MPRASSFSRSAPSAARKRVLRRVKSIDSADRSDAPPIQHHDLSPLIEPAGTQPSDATPQTPKVEGASRRGYAASSPDVDPARCDPIPVEMEKEKAKKGIEFGWEQNLFLFILEMFGTLLTGGLLLNIKI